MSVLLKHECGNGGVYLQGSHVRLREIQEVRALYPRVGVLRLQGAHEVLGPPDAGTGPEEPGTHQH